MSVQSVYEPVSDNTSVDTENSVLSMISASRDKLLESSTNRRSATLTPETVADSQVYLS